MCGIFGCIHRANFDFSINSFNKLNQYLSHRGPDSEGVLEVQKDDPTFIPNRRFGRDMFNVSIGIIWQMALVVWPIFLMIKKWDALALSIAVLAITSLVLKYCWYYPLKKEVTQ